MAVVTNRFLYLHVPKTGGTFFGGMVSTVWTMMGLSYCRTVGGGAEHSVEPIPREHLTGQIILMGVRHPMSWVRSFWMHMQRAGGADKPFGAMPLADELTDMARRSTTFPRFLDSVVNASPLVSYVFGTYQRAYGKSKGEVVLLHRETLGMSFLAFAEEYGLLQNIKEANRNRLSDVIACMSWSTSDRAPRIDYKMCDRLREADPEAFSDYGY